MSVAFLIVFAGFLLIVAGVKNISFVAALTGKGLPGVPAS